MRERMSMRMRVWSEMRERPALIYYVVVGSLRIETFLFTWNREKDLRLEVLDTCVVWETFWT